jgi:RNA polymerase sigma-70 factor (ECF subfamily)
LSGEWPVSESQTSAEVSRAYVDWRDDVYRYLLRLGLYPPQAQEAAQEVFLRLYTTLRKSSEPIANPRAWVFRTAHNLGLTLRARENRSRPFEPEWETMIPDTGRSPEARLIEREKLLRVHQAVGDLSPQQRQCLRLRAEGLRYHEIAEIIGVSVSTVYEFLRRGIARLRKAVYE